MEKDINYTHPVHKPNLTEQQKKQHWQQIVADFTSSGQRQVDFARENRIKNDHLSYYYRKHLKGTSENKFLKVSVQPTALATNMEMKIIIQGHELSIPYSSYKEKLQIVKDLLGEYKC